MVKKTHIQGGVIVALLSNPMVLGALSGVENTLYKLVLVIVYIYGACFGSLLPDIDMRGSYISRTIPMMYKVFGKHFKHRGFTHSALSLVIFYILTKMASGIHQGEYAVEMFFSGIFMGCLSHILMDLFTKEGVELFYPVKKVISFSGLKTSSAKERKLNKVLELVIFMVLGANLYIMMSSSFQPLQSRVETGIAKIQIQKD